MHKLDVGDMFVVTTATRVGMVAHDMFKGRREMVKQAQEKAPPGTRAKFVRIDRDWGDASAMFMVIPNV